MGGRKNLGAHPILPYQQTADWRIGCEPEFFSPTYPTWALVVGTSRPAGETVCSHLLLSVLRITVAGQCGMVGDWSAPDASHSDLLRKDLRFGECCGLHCLHFAVGPKTVLYILGCKNTFACQNPSHPSCLLFSSFFQTKLSNLIKIAI